LSTATADAVKALDAFGKDKVIIETVGAGQNEIDIVRAADTVAVLVPPGSGDNVQMLKAGILEIADVFVVNKADVDGADRTVQELKEMVHMGDGHVSVSGGHHGMGVEADVDMPGDDEPEHEPWETPVLETVATTGEGVDAFLSTLAEHADWLADTGQLAAKRRMRTAEEIRTLLRNDAASIVEAEIAERGGVEEMAERVLAGDTDPYTIADDVLAPMQDAIRET